MARARPDDGGTDLDEPVALPAGGTSGRPVPATRGRTRRPAWSIFIGLALVVVVVDQLTKAWLVGSVQPGTARLVIGDLIRLVDVRNDGALFGLFGSAAPVFALASLGIVGLIVWYHAHAARNPVLSVALGLLLGGALGNFIDRARFGYVVDWIDMGIGNVRFWTFNVGDSGITCAILLIIVLALWPGLGAMATDD